jgi:TRAP-type C4-dicarboxylate transport system permease small subunit
MEDSLGSGIPGAPPRKEFGGGFGRGLLILQKTLIISCSLLVAIAITASAVLRYVLKLDLYGLEEIVVIFAFWLYFSGAAYGAYEDSHIAAGIVDVYVKNDRIRTLLNSFSYLVTTLLTYLFTYWAFQMLSWTIGKHGATPVWRIPLAIPQGAILFGMGLMSFYFTIHLFERFRLMRTGFGGSPDRPGA